MESNLGNQIKSEDRTSKEMKILVREKEYYHCFSPECWKKDN